MLRVLSLLVLSYVAGSTQSAELVGRRAGIDPRAAGSGNPGATNVLRLGGPRAGAVVLLADLLKGFLPTMLASALQGPAVGAAAGAAAVLGHVAPIGRGLRGGKGVATTAGVSLALAPLAAGTAATAFVLVAAATRLVSLGSVVAALTLPVAAELLGAAPSTVLVLGVLALLVVARHGGNLRRVRSGTEPRLGAPSSHEEPACSEQSARR